MGKRGRKPSTEKKPKGYFYEEQEQAVLDYLAADTAEEKDKIYNAILRPAFDKMIESIIRRYNLYVPDEIYEHTFHDTASFLITKMDKFDPSRNKRAYSYYGNVCKNYLIGRIEHYKKQLQRNPSYDEAAEEYNNSIKYSDAEDKSAQIASETVEKLIKRIDTMCASPEDYDLKESEVRLGKALKTLLEHWEYVLSTAASNKLNKNAILLFLRENTGLDTKGVRDNMKKFKREFLLVKDEVIN